MSKYCSIFFTDIKLLVLISMIICSCGMVSCKKDANSSGMAYLEIRLTDAPANYDEINVEIIGVEIKGSAAGTLFMDVVPGIYNLLDLTGGIDTLIATAGIPAGKLQQIRLILGQNNSIVVDGISYPLQTPSAMQSGLKLQVHEELVGGVSYSILLDFDAAQSIVELGNGQYSLKPVIRVIDEAISGSITGSVLPAMASIPVTATNGLNAYSSYTDSTGFFLISGVPSGNYILTINPPAPLNSDTLNGVGVVVGQITNVGVIQL
jgi:hypothetical protein